MGSTFKASQLVGMKDKEFSNITYSEATRLLKASRSTAYSRARRIINAGFQVNEEYARIMEITEKPSKDLRKLKGQLVQMKNYLSNEKISTITGMKREIKSSYKSVLRYTLGLSDSEFASVKVKLSRDKTISAVVGGKTYAADEETLKEVWALFRNTEELLGMKVSEYYKKGSGEAVKDIFNMVFERESQGLGYQSLSASDIKRLLKHKNKAIKKAQAQAMISPFSIS